MASVRAHVALLESLGDVVGDVGGERGLSHAGSARKDDQIGWLQPAHSGIEVGQTGREP